MNGPTEKIPVTTIPPGATVTEGKVAILTPGIIELQRRRDHILTITKKGYKTKNVKIVHVINGWVAGNIVSFGIVGAGVDAATGAMWNLQPSTITVRLRPAKENALLPFEQRLTPKTLPQNLQKLSKLKQKHLLTDSEYKQIQTITIQCAQQPPALTLLPLSPK